MLYTLRILLSQPTRLFLTVAGITLCMILMLFLFGIYKGVADGSVDYVRANRADLWVLQGNSTNILRGTSILTSYQKNLILKNPNVEKAAQVLLLLTTVKNGAEHSTVFLAGYEDDLYLGGPPRLLKGRNVKSDDEIVLDNSFAAKYKFSIGNKLTILNDTLNVVGISGGTNAFVIQFAFTTLKEAQSLLGFPNVVTCFLVKLKQGKDSFQTAEEIRSSVKGINVYNHADFLQNNIKEMESGFLPILYAVAGLGAIVLTTVLSLILSINILEKKKEFAVIKILGAPKDFLPKLIIKQSLIIIITAAALSLIFFFPVVFLIENISPEVGTKTTLLHFLLVLSAGILMGLISSFISIKRLRKIYPLEVFYDK
jgi:ABC-type antimicrobial peptide transport system permease subunit